MKGPERVQAALKAAGLDISKVGKLLEVAAEGQVTEASKILASAYGGGKGGWGKADAQVAGAGDKTEAAARTDADFVTVAREIGEAVAKVGLPVLKGLLGLQA